jgi:hypothetical protein
MQHYILSNSVRTLLLPIHKHCQLHLTGQAAEQCWHQLAANLQATCQVGLVQVVCLQGVQAIAGNRKTAKH